MKHVVPGLFCAVVMTFLSVVAVVADDAEEALRLAKQGVKLVDSGKPEEALVLLDSAARLDPGNILYPYEKAYVYAVLKRYEEAVDILEPLVEHEKAEDEIYRLLGNSYDYLGESDKALETYNAGLERFPDSGKLYHEIGVVHFHADKMEEALESFDRGIMADPTFPSNYYQASTILAMSEQKLWALIYGEMFLNIERNSKRSLKMSELLYTIYNESIAVKGHTSASVSLVPSISISLDDLNNPDAFRPGFEMTYEMNLTMALAGHVGPGKHCSSDSLSLACLSGVREAFVTLWEIGENREQFPNALLDWQRELKDRGYFTAYNYWLLNQGNEEEARQWFADNETNAREFFQWFTEHPMPVSRDNYVHWKQYRKK